MQRIRLSLLLGLLLVASGPAQLASFGREGRLAVGDPIAYAEAVGPDFPARQPELLRLLDAKDVPGMRRHMWRVWAAMTHETHSRYPRFLTWHQVSETFGAEPASGERAFKPEFRIPSQKNIGSGDAILSFNIYNDSFRYHVRRNNYHLKNTLLSMVGRVTDIVEFPNDSILVKTVW